MYFTLDNQVRMHKTSPFRLVPLSLPQTQNAKLAPNPISVPSNAGGNLMDLSMASSARSPLTVEEKKHWLSIIATSN